MEVLHTSQLPVREAAGTVVCADETLIFFNEFMDHREALTSFARSLGGQDADDIVQTTFEKAFNRRDSLYAKPNYNMRNWLYAIARNTYLDQWRRETRQTTVDAQDHLALYDRVESYPFDQPIVEQGLGSLLVGTLEAHDNAPGKSTQFAHLAEHLYGGMSIPEYAEEFGVKPATVRTRLHRMKSHLQQIGFLEQLQRDGWL
jgi:RNA polymerase sigma-70 factor (ECF subfamily)